MTTTVVAYTSFCDGQVTRFSSLRTSERNNRIRSSRPPAAPLTASNLPASSATLFLAPANHCHPDHPELASASTLRATSAFALPRFGETAYACQLARLPEARSHVPRA